MPEIIPPSGEISFEQNKTKFFTELSLRVKKALELHRQAGLWERKDGRRDWGNVSEHCLAETARVTEFAKLLNLPSAIKNNLMLAAAVHDYNKKDEIIAMKTAGKTGESELTASKDADARKTERMREAGFSDDIIHLANAMGGHPAELIECKRLLDKQDFTDEDITYLVLHYVDDISQGSDWVKESDGTKNTIDYRIEATQQKLGYSKIGEEIAAELEKNEFFKGMNVATAMATVSHLIERRLAKLIQDRSGVEIEPLKIPEYIDQKIREKIENLQT
ncbi:MAG: hypothetical protein AB1352_04180 [Patescibacteria group bacterium]